MHTPLRRPDTGGSLPTDAKRVILISLTAALVLLIGAAVATSLLGDRALDRGRREYRSALSFGMPVERLHPARPVVVWLGDSTTMGANSYPWLVARQLATPIELRNTSLPGSQPHLFYMLLGRYLPLEPDAVIILAHLRLLTPAADTPPFVQLSSLMTEEQAVRAAMLPWHAQRVTYPRLQIARWIEWHPEPTAFLRLEGARELFRDWMWPTAPPSIRHLGQHRKVRLENYDGPIRENTPSIRMLLATTREARRAGSEVIVVVAPIPLDELKDNHLYGPKTRHRINTIREAATAAGATVIDLHDTVPREEFRDYAGHLTKAGAQRVANVLAPIVETALGGRQ